MKSNLLSFFVKIIDFMEKNQYTTILNNSNTVRHI